MRGAEAEASTGEVGHMENAKALFTMREAEAERQAEAARNFFIFFYPDGGSDTCCRSGNLAFAAEKGRGWFAPKFSKIV